MPNYATNLLTFYGTGEALREAMVLLSQALPFQFHTADDGAYCHPEYDTSRVPAGAAVPPLSRSNHLEPEAIMPVHLRYRGFGADGWRAPFFFEHRGFELTLRGASIPEALLDGGRGAAEASEQIVELVLSCSSRDVPPRHVLQELSRRLPRLVIQCEFEELRNDVLGAVAYQAGEVVAKHDVERTVTRESLGLDPDDDSEDAYDRLNEEHLAQGRREIDERVTPLAQDAALARGATRSGWSALTRAAGEGGVAGLSRMLAHEQDFSDKLAALVHDLSASTRRGRASWLDACLYGNDALEDLLRHALATPGVSHDADAWHLPFSISAGKCFDLLAACAADAPDRMFASAMVAVLSDPATRLMSGIHPIAILTDACKDSRFSAAGEGLRRIIDQLRAQVPMLPEAPLVGIEFLRHGSGDRNAEVRNLLLGGLLTANDATSLPVLKVSAALKAPAREHGPGLNPGYRFDPESDGLLRSLLHCGLQGGQAGLDLALAAGFDETFLFRSLAHICPKEALANFVAVKGDVRLLTQGMSTALAAACARLGDHEALTVYAALKAEAEMKGVIDAVAPAGGVPPRRRPRGCV